ncbi:hypothetical protein RFM41_25280 [Mesorhizobium sp. VK25A]|uniref:Uncharacterized protein n=1 Tax=Mesorhizobium vachelliae TaxID=3072309 RepID=A0ABU5ABD7_9HYPH|nr:MULTISPECIES: hypothetical protein [unclassified Mesorhizobium]MDX8534442.1 hypothetical protein [Mesorhizobium sp. VK25D]MDX8547084.1 hypothetical protein [Mesorhizobium sp. VK25A]
MATLNATFPLPAEEKGETTAAAMRAAAKTRAMLTLKAPWLKYGLYRGELQWALKTTRAEITRSSAFADRRNRFPPGPCDTAHGPGC